MKDSSSNLFSGVLPMIRQHLSLIVSLMTIFTAWGAADSCGVVNDSIAITGISSLNHVSNMIAGVVVDADGNPLDGIIIRLYDSNRIRGFGKTDKTGEFRLKAPEGFLKGRLTFNSTSFASEEIGIELPSDPLRVVMVPEAYSLKEVVALAPRVRMKGDTISYDVAAYTSASDRNIEDVIRKLPGIVVEDNGTISYQGEPINKFYIEGLDLMSSNYSVASRNISPSDIATVSIYERHQPKRVIKDIVDSDKAALNLTLKKKSMLRPVGYVGSGVGAGDDCLLTGTLYGMMISPGMQTIISATGNNTGSNFQSLNASTSPFGVFSLTPFCAPSLATNRYLQNKSGSGSINTLFRSKNDFLLSANVDWQGDHASFSGNTSTTYITAGDSTISYDEAIDNHIGSQRVATVLKAEKNGEQLFFNDSFSFSGRFTDNCYDVLSDGNGAVQNEVADWYYFSNSLQAIFKRGKKRVVDVRSDTYFSRAPLNRVSATGNLLTLGFMSQSAAGEIFHNEESTSFSWGHGASTFGVDLSFSFDHETFNSISIIGEASDNEQYLSGSMTAATARPWYKLKVGKVTWTASVPLNYRNYSLRRRPDGNSLTRNRLFPGFATDMTWRVSGNMFIESSAGLNHNCGSLEDYLNEPIMTTFRNSVTLGSGNLKKVLTKYLDANFNFRDPFNGIYAQGRGSISFSDNSTINSSHITESDISATALAISNKGFRGGGSLSVSKDFRKINTLVNVNASGFWTESKTIRNSAVMQVGSDIYSINLRGETTQFYGKLEFNVNLGYNVIRQSVMPDGQVNYLTQIMSFSKLSYMPKKNLLFYVATDFGRDELEKGHYKYNMFVDAGMRFTYHRLHAELSARNLTNLQSYGYTIYRSIDIVSSSYVLRPREVVLSFRYDF